MALSAPANPKINTNPTHPGRARPVRSARERGKAADRRRGPAGVSGDTRESVRDSARVVMEVGWGVLVYPPEEAGQPWRATFTENGRRRFRQAMTEAELAVSQRWSRKHVRAGRPPRRWPMPRRARRRSRRLLTSACVLARRVGRSRLRGRG